MLIVTMQGMHAILHHKPFTNICCRAHIVGLEREVAVFLQEKQLLAQENQCQLTDLQTYERKLYGISLLLFLRFH